MRFAVLVLVTIQVLFIWNSEARQQSKACYAAKTCIHKANGKCGVDGKGKVRRFYDTCDILEYNCLFNTNFRKTIKNRCRKLPSINSNEVEERGRRFRALRF
ncbi:uncharacterized protein LOC142982225 [Anticarsia gemmatalis]|uniref:uncharacterized protein LOC142982225 n=1 Tax=Anticarsia gemmatalis TaxID=129554 RepID=UPI003F757362